jgi:hypothetical protein
MVNPHCFDLMFNLMFNLILKIFQSIVLVFLTFTVSMAQSGTLTGRVVSESRDYGLPGVNVIEKGMETGVITDLDGYFSINVLSENPTLIFSLIGYVTQQYVVGNRSIIEIALSYDSQKLDEIIITAYGTADKGNFTGSAVSLKSDQIAKRPINNILNAIEGQVAGVMTTSASGQPGWSSTPNVRIRGIGSVNASSIPYM